jgi:SAM-dependent methyltransferase
VIERLCAFGRGGHARLLDLGCGTGQLLLQLADFFESTVGMDPEPDMLREARRAARERGVLNAEWIRGSSTELREVEPALGRFDLVTIGTAFHFMDPRATLAELQRITDGGVAVLYNGTPMWLHPDPWARAVRGVLESRLGRVGDTDFTAVALRAAEEVMRELGYAEVERWEHVHEERVDTEFVAGHILSATSSDQIPTAEREHFARELSDAIASVEPSGRVIETVAVRIVIGRPKRK